MFPPISRITLGTAQFGQSYGVANRSGAPDLSEVCGMLEEAAAAGINCLDTARAYGQSEEYLGLALARTGLKDHFHVVTKTTPALPADATQAEAEGVLRESLETSLRLLGLDRLATVLLHRDTTPVHLDALATLREAGLIERSGVSLGNVENANRLAGHPALDAIQAPANVLDRRFQDSISQVHASGGTVFTRSCYLQGLLLMDDEATPAHLRIVIPARNFYRQLAGELGIDLPALLLRAMLDRPDIDSVVVGMENRAQLRENIRIFQMAPLNEATRAKLDAFRPELPSWLIDPPQWGAHAIPS